MIHNIALHIFGMVGTGAIDRVAFWTALSAIITLALTIIALVQLRAVNKTTRAEFVHKFTNGFFNQNCRNLVFLFDHNLLEFKSKKLHNGDEIVWFELDEKVLHEISGIDAKDKERFKKVYTSYDVDDELLGHFEDLGNYSKQRLLDIQMVYEVFSSYIISIWENEEIGKYVTWIRSDGGCNYDGFEYIYDKVKAWDKKYLENKR